MIHASAMSTAVYSDVLLLAVMEVGSWSVDAVACSPKEWSLYSCRMTMACAVCPLS